MSSDEGLTISEAARELGISEQTVRRRVKRGELPALQVERAQGYEYRILLTPTNGHHVLSDSRPDSRQPALSINLDADGHADEESPVHAPDQPDSRLDSPVAAGEESPAQPPHQADSRPDFSVWRGEESVDGTGYHLPRAARQPEESPHHAVDMSDSQDGNGKLTPDLSSFATLALEQGREIVRLNNERAELYGRLGYLQAELTHTKELVRALQSPPEELLAEEEPPHRPWWKFWG